MKPLRKSTGLTMLAIGLCIAAPAAVTAADFPAHPVKFIVPWNAGGGADKMVRLLGQALTERWSQPVLVENKPGADATLGIRSLVTGPADGYTIALIQTSHAVLPSVKKSMPYDLLRDIAPVSLIGEAASLIVINPKLPVQNVPDLIALSKKKSLNFGVPGLGGPGHLGGVMFNNMANIEATNIPYTGGAPTLIAVIRGDVDYMFTTLLTGMPLAKSGQVRPIAITSLERSPFFPDLPTVSESGLKGYELVSWYGVVTHAGAPKPVVEQLAKDIAAVLREPKMAAQLAADGIKVIAGGPDLFSNHLKAEVKKWSGIVKQANIQPE